MKSALTLTLAALLASAPAAALDVPKDGSRSVWQIGEIEVLR